MIKKTIFAVFVLLLNSALLTGQKNDTIRISAKDINTGFLREGTHRYIVYFKMKKDSIRTLTQFWTRTIRRTEYNKTPAIQITQEWEDKDSIVHIVKSYSDAKTMQPLYHNTWWKIPVSRNSPTKTTTSTIVDVLNKTVQYNGVFLGEADTTRRTKKIWDSYKTSIDKYFLNWHLDLETFPLLPYRNGVTFIIPFYDPGTASDFQTVAYTVKGEAELEGYDQQKIKCWILVHESTGNKETFWISKKTREVLKLEQELGPDRRRYKIKFGFSN
ncbi:MAG: hypothetical protein I8H66_02875 [Sphingobacteriia bacterium]|nr:hypothetical protein [Sphingobacteriia bacterium]